MRLHQYFAGLVLLAALGSSAWESKPVTVDTRNTPWHGLVLQIDVQHPGADWVAREVRGLRFASSEQGNVRRAFVDVDGAGSSQRFVTVTCEGKKATRDITPEGMQPMLTSCYEVRYRITTVGVRMSRQPSKKTMVPALGD